MKTKETDLEHYNSLRAVAEHASHRTGVLVSVKLAEYWIGGRQQTDYYSVREPDSVRGPMSFQAARDYLEGLR